MEKRSPGVKSVLMVFLILGLLVGQSTASNFTTCYAFCFVPCIIDIYPKDVVKCAVLCLKKCISQPDTHSSCKLGCATSRCINLSTKDNPAAEKVESCVNNCSETCT
ncbi:hypothetical protein Ddye_011001 [Dipteronia dyeriana]|uniref:Thionin-like protein 2 n=1 Tax=Dipteronia dyeriana TaxID=168575 RepID=A0AAD9XEG5_9ROSI|nr:hypothetical protein Ddye_011001 [Dipteronia dyeriana]